MRNPSKRHTIGATEAGQPGEGDVKGQGHQAMGLPDNHQVFKEVT